MEGGSLFFKVKQIGGTMGNLHGLYFDVTDESILNTLRVNAVSNDIRIGEDSISCLRNGANMNESCVSDKDYVIGLEAGKTDIGRDDINSYSFTLSSTARALLFSDFSRIQLDSSEDYGSSSSENKDDNSHRWLYMGLL